MKLEQEGLTRKNEKTIDCILSIKKRRKKNIDKKNQSYNPKSNILVS